MPLQVWAGVTDGLSIAEPVEDLLGSIGRMDAETGVKIIEVELIADPVFSEFLKGPSSGDGYAVGRV
jgi:hypothetical protein